MSQVIAFAADHQTIIALLGTVAAIVAALSGYGRRHRVASARREPDRGHPPG